MTNQARGVKKLKKFSRNSRGYIYDFLHVIVDCCGNDMSIDKIEKDIQGIKKEFSEISPEKATKAVSVQKKKRSHSIVIWVVVIVLILALLVLALFFL